MTSPTSPPSWTRRFSHPAIPLPLPTLPNISAFRAALLGYLGEVELSLRSETSTPLSLSPSDEDTGSSTAVPGPSTRLRNRNGAPAASLLGATNTSLLNHLSNLREDVVAYLPSRLSVPVPHGIGPSREWLRSLPSKLSVVDLCVATADGESQIEAARRRVIEVVHTFLPSEDWAGWESLGWEEQDGPPKLSPVYGEDEDEEEEPEYLFPNRTPASTSALAKRRQARSKSVSSAWVARHQPKLVRSRTEPLRDTWQRDGKEVVPHELDAAQIVNSPELADTKLTAAVAPSNLGPTLGEALARSGDGNRLIGYEDLPYVWRNNEHVLLG